MEPHSSLQLFAVLSSRAVCDLVASVTDKSLGLFPLEVGVVGDATPFYDSAEAAYWSSIRSRGRMLKVTPSVLEAVAKQQQTRTPGRPKQASTPTPKKQRTEGPNETDEDLTLMPKDLFEAPSNILSIRISLENVLNEWTQRGGAYRPLSGVVSLGPQAKILQVDTVCPICVPQNEQYSSMAELVALTRLNDSAPATARLNDSAPATAAPTTTVASRPSVTGILAAVAAVHAVPAVSAGESCERLVFFLAVTPSFHNCIYTHELACMSWENFTSAKGLSNSKGVPLFQDCNKAFELLQLHRRLEKATGSPTVPQWNVDHSGDSDLATQPPAMGVLYKISMLAPDVLRLVTSGALTTGSQGQPIEMHMLKGYIPLTPSSFTIHYTSIQNTVRFTELSSTLGAMAVKALKCKITDCKQEMENAEALLKELE